MITLGIWSIAGFLIRLAARAGPDRSYWFTITNEDTGELVFSSGPLLAIETAVVDILGQLEILTRSHRSPHPPEHSGDRH